MPNPNPLVFAFGLLVVLAATSAQGTDWGPLTLRERTTEPGQKQKYSFATAPSIEAAYLDLPVWVARGAVPGPTLCITAAVHGDELNGTEIARRAFAEIDPTTLRGTVVVLPIVNASGFRTTYRYMPDRRDLNRYFPGREDGSLAGWVAFAIFHQVIAKCDALVDLHTGSLRRSNLPQIRVDLSNPKALGMARHFSAGVVLGGGGPEGSLRRAAMDAGIPAILYEAGAPNSFQEEHIVPGVRGLQNTMAHLGLLPPLREDHSESRVFTKTRWVRVPRLQGGFYFPKVALGTVVEAGDLLGTVTDFRTDAVHAITAPAAGEVIGMAIPQVVLSGYALFHLGITEATDR